MHNRSPLDQYLLAIIVGLGLSAASLYMAIAKPLAPQTHRPTVVIDANAN